MGVGVTGQLALEVEPASLSVRRTDPDTSAQAAASITPGRTERAILDTLREHPAGLTADELSVHLAPVFPPTLKSALARVHKAGLARDTGERRPSARGRDSIVWALA